MRKINKTVLTAVAVVSMVVIGISLNAAAILDNGKKEVKSEKFVPANGWYGVTTPSGDPTLPANQLIGSLLSVAPPLEDEEGCAQENDGVRCAVYLEFTGSATTVPSTVAGAIPANGVIFDGTDAKHIIE